MKKNKLFWIMLALCAANFVAQLCVYPVLPETVPMHWGANGQADGWGDKWQVLILALLPFGIVLLMQVVRRIDPKHENFARFEKAWNVFTLLMTVDVRTGQLWLDAGRRKHGADAGAGRLRRAVPCFGQLYAADQAELHLWLQDAVGAQR